MVNCLAVPEASMHVSRRIGVHAALLGALLMLCGCGSGSGSSGYGTGPTTGGVAGTVTHNTATRDFLEGVVVTIGHSSDTTDATGRYRLRYVPAG